jgi:hypothetical protein
MIFVAVPADCGIVGGFWASVVALVLDAPTVGGALIVALLYAGKVGFCWDMAEVATAEGKRGLCAIM